MKKLLILLLLLSSYSLYSMDSREEILNRPKTFAQLIALYGTQNREDFKLKSLNDSIFQIMVAPDIVLNPFEVKD